MAQEDNGMTRREFTEGIAGVFITGGILKALHRPQGRETAAEESEGKIEVLAYQEGQTDETAAEEPQNEEESEGPTCDNYKQGGALPTDPDTIEVTELRCNDGVQSVEVSFKAHCAGEIDYSDVVVNFSLKEEKEPNNFVQIWREEEPAKHEGDGEMWTIFEIPREKWERHDMWGLNGQH